MSEMRTYRARERGYVDDRMVEEDEIFSTTAPKGRWMALLDDKGNELPDPDPAPVSTVDASAEAIEAVRRELTEKAKVIIDDMRRDFDEQLRAETERADNTRDELDKLKANVGQVLADADAATDKATQRAEAAEKERDALKAELEKLKAPATGAKK